MFDVGFEDKSLLLAVHSRVPLHVYALTSRLVLSFGSEIRNDRREDAVRARDVRLPRNRGVESYVQIAGIYHESNILSYIQTISYKHITSIHLKLLSVLLRQRFPPRTFKRIICSRKTHLCSWPFRSARPTQRSRTLGALELKVTRIHHSRKRFQVPDLFDGS